MSSKGFTSSARVSPAPGAYISIRASDFGITPSLGPAGSASLLAGQAISSVATTVISGDLDISPNGSSSVTGAYTIGGATHEADAVAAAAQVALASAIASFQAAAVGHGTPIAAALGGQTLTVAPGTTTYYTEASSTFAMANGTTLTINGSGIAVFICSSTLILGTTAVIAGTTPAGNIYWIVGSSATIGAGSTFKGRVLAHTSITDNGGNAVAGQYLANIGSISLVGSATTITTPAAPGAGSSIQAALPGVSPNSSSDYFAVVANTGSQWKVQKSVDFMRPDGLADPVGISLEHMDCVSPNYPGVGAVVALGNYMRINGYLFVATNNGTTAAVFIGFSNFKTVNGALTTDGTVIWQSLGKAILVRIRFSNSSLVAQTPVAQEYDLFEQ